MRTFDSFYDGQKKFNSKRKNEDQLHHIKIQCPPSPLGAALVDAVVCCSGELLEVVEVVVCCCVVLVVDHKSAVTRPRFPQCNFSS